MRIRLINQWAEAPNESPSPGAYIKMEIYPKVLVGAPVSDHHEYCFDTFVESLKGLTYPNLNIFLVDNSKTLDFYEKVKKHFNVIKYKYHPNVKKRLSDCRNILRQKVLDEGYDYLFCLDQDVIPPKDVIKRLSRHNKKVVSGVYFNKFTRFSALKGKYETRMLPVAWKQHPKYSDKAVFVNEDEIKKGGLLKVVLCGTGCVLIHRSILEKIKFRYDDSKTGVDDSFFCIDCKKLGIDIFADLDLICKHHVEGRQISWGDEDLKV